MLKNKTKKTIISRKERELKKFSEISTGLMFKKKLKEGEAYYFTLPKTKKWVITMLFVFQTIDLIFCKENEVVEIKENARPFLDYKAKTEANKLIEVPPGTIKRTKTQVGDVTQYLKKRERN